MIYSNLSSCSEDAFRSRALFLIRQNFNPSEFAALFCLDKGNVCAYFRGSKKIPLSLCFSVLDYLGCRTVVFSPV